MSVRLPATTRGVFTCLLSVMFVAGCFDQDTPVAPTVAQPSLSLSSMPLEDVGELPPFVEIANEVPSFGGFWFNEKDQIVVAVTDLADFERVAGMIPRYLGAHQPTGYVAMQVERSFADLARFRAVLRAPAFARQGVVSLGVKESANRVEVGITDPGVEATVRGLARGLGIPDEALVIARVPEPRVHHIPFGVSIRQGESRAGGRLEAVLVGAAWGSRRSESTVDRMSS